MHPSCVELPFSCQTQQVQAMEDKELKIRDADMSWRQVGDEVIVLDLRSNAYLSINETGTALWEMLVDGSTPATMAERLMSEFSVGEARARADVEAFVAVLTERDLLQ
jgi:coenzyme PQQ synthesis protein D (PqqD)